MADAAPTPAQNAETVRLTDEEKRAVADALPWVQHADCEWEEVPPCVYCKTHRERLYQGSLPAEKNPELAAKRTTCEHLEHVMDDDGNEHGQGWYWLCADCGFKGWYE